MKGYTIGSLLLLSALAVSCRKKDTSPDYTSKLSKVRHWNGHFHADFYRPEDSLYNEDYDYPDTAFGLVVSDGKTVNGVRYDSLNSTNEVYYFGNNGPYSGTPMLSIVYFVKSDSVVITSRITANVFQSYSIRHSY